MTDPLGVYIGPREIYDKLVLIDASVRRVSDQIAELAKDVGDHEVRLRSLEKGRWPLPALATLVSVASLALAVIPQL